MPDQTNIPPVPIPSDDIPPMPPMPQGDINPQPSTPSTTQAPDIPPVITGSKGKGGGGKVVAAILGILLLIGAVGAGVVLVGQKQLFQQKASCIATGDAGCHLNGDCCSGKCQGQECVPAPTATPCKNSGSCTWSSECCTNLCQGGICMPPAPTAIATPSCQAIGGNCSVNLNNCCNTDQNYCKATGGGFGICTKTTSANPPPPAVDCSQIKCTASSCTVGSLYSGCYVNYYTCQTRKPGGCSDTLVKSSQSASFSANCGTEQIDVYCPACGSSLTNANCTRKTNDTCFISKTYDTDCGGGATAKPSTPGTPTPPPTAPQCNSVKAYDTSWNELSQAQLSALKEGDVVIFTVSGSPADQIDKAKFTVTAGTTPTDSGELTQKKPGTEEYYYKYTIPAGATSFSVSAQIHSSSIGWF